MFRKKNKFIIEKEKTTLLFTWEGEFIEERLIEEREAQQKNLTGVEKRKENHRGREKHHGLL